MELTRDDRVHGERFKTLADFCHYKHDDAKAVAFLRSFKGGHRALYANARDARQIFIMIRLVPEVKVTLITHHSDGVVRATGVRAIDADLPMLPSNVVRWYVRTSKLCIH